MEVRGVVGSTFTDGWDCSCVMPSLWVGAATAVCLPCVHALGITHVLSVMRDGPSSIPGVQHLAVDAVDCETEFLLDCLPAALKFIQSALDAGGCVLVHCQHGHSRSVAVAAAFLMRSRNISASAAHDAISSGRLIDVNPAFQVQLLLLQHAVDLVPNLHVPAHSRWRMARLQSHIFASRDSSRPPITDLQPFAAPASADARDGLRCSTCSETIALRSNVV